MKIMVTGGGTGGHIYPALAAASALRDLVPGLQLLYGGRAGGLEERLAGEAAIPFHPLPGRAIVRGAGALRSVLLIARGALIARALLQKERPDVVVGTGGFASTALASAQASLRRPLVLVEGNAVPGRTNRLLARSATAVCIAFDGAASFLPPGRTVRTGFPVRAGMAETRGRSEARRSFGLAEECFTLLVVGGSQGARFFNNLMRVAGPRLLQSGVQILHQLGARNADYDAPAAEGWVRLQYIEDMPSALASADVVLSRAGASTLSEMAVQGCAAILVPYPYAHADHQTANARELASAGRALLVPEPEMTAECLVSTISGLKQQPDTVVRMGARLKAWATPDAAKRVAEVVLRAVPD